MPQLYKSGVREGMTGGHGAVPSLPAVSHLYIPHIGRACFCAQSIHLGSRWQEGKLDRWAEPSFKTGRAGAAPASARSTSAGKVLNLHLHLL